MAEGGEGEKAGRGAECKFGVTAAGFLVALPDFAGFESAVLPMHVQRNEG